MMTNIIGVFVMLLAIYLADAASELPPECNDYLVLDDPTRNVNHGYEYNGDVSGSYCTSVDWQGRNQWYRVIPPAGEVIPQTSVKWSHCGTYNGGWINGNHPTDVGQHVEVEVCFSADGYEDYDDCVAHHNIGVTNCGSYFVYYLTGEGISCGVRYCSADTL